LYVANLGKDKFILGYPWFCSFTPDIDWIQAQLRGPKVSIETTHLATAERVQNYMDKKRQTSSMAKAECDPWFGVTAPEMECGRERTTAAEIFQRYMGIKHAHTAMEMAHKYTEEHGATKVTLPEEFKHHTTLFLEEEANQFPPSRGEADHKVVLLETTPTKFNCKVYPMSQKEWETEDKFLDENLAKGYIVPSDSPYSFSTFMVPKKDSKEMRYIIDYPPPNAVTRKDVTLLPNLGQCIENLQGMELFSKFDIRWGYNNICIRSGDELKAAFKTRRGLFKPKVMFFGLSNSPASF